MRVDGRIIAYGVWPDNDDKDFVDKLRARWYTLLAENVACRRRNVAPLKTSLIGNDNHKDNGRKKPSNT